MKSPFCSVKCVFLQKNLLEIENKNKKDLSLFSTIQWNDVVLKTVLQKIFVLCIANANIISRFCHSFSLQNFSKNLEGEKNVKLFFKQSLLNEETAYFSLPKSNKIWK